MAVPVEAPSLEVRIEQAQAEGLGPNLSRWYAFANGPEFIELQVLKVADDRGFTSSRYAHATSIEKAIELAEVGSRLASPGVFVIGNPIDPAITTRGPVDRWITMQKGGAATSDDCVLCKTELYIDVDAIRPQASSTSSTDEQMGAARDVALRVYAELAAVLEDDSAIGYAHSGNGRAVLLALASLEKARASKLHHAILEALGARFDSPGAKVDRTTFDPKRLHAAFGTMKTKGRAGVMKWPHRRTAFVAAAEVRRLGYDELETILETLRHGLGDDVQKKIDAALGVKPSKTAAPSATRHAGDDAFAQAKLVPIGDVLRWLGLFDDEQPTCCGCGLRDSGVAVVGNGLKCSHDRCSGLGMPPGFRTTIDAVAEAHHVAPVVAVRELAERFGFSPPAPRKQDTAHDAQPDDEFWFGGAEAGTDSGGASVALTGEWLYGEDLAKPLPPLEYIVKSLALPAGAGAPHIFGGFGFSGKTVAAQQMLLALAAGRNVWKAFGGPGRAYRCGHLDGEQGIALSQTRYQRLAHGHGIELADVTRNLRLRSYPKLSSGERLFLCLEHRAFWKEIMSDLDLLLVDSFAAMRSGDMSENAAEARRVLDMLSELSEETKCRPLIIAHAKKSGEERPGFEPDAREALRGNSAIYDAGDSIYILSGKKGEAVRVEQTKARSHGEPIADFALVITDVGPHDDPKWGLSVVVHGTELIDEQREAARLTKREAKIARNANKIRVALPTGARLSKESLRAKTGLNGGDFNEAWAELETKGETLIDLVKSGRSTLKMHSLISLPLGQKGRS